MAKRETRRVLLALQAYGLLESADAFVTDARKLALSERLASVLRQLSPDESTAYYAALKSMRYPQR
jgi:hypothetical protein